MLDFPVGGFKPSCHIYYEMRVMDMPDGLTKFKDVGKEHNGTGETMPERVPESEEGATS